MSPDDLEAIRGVVRDELRRCDLRPPLPPDLGAYRWDAASDAWIPLDTPHASQDT